MHVSTVSCTRVLWMSAIEVTGQYRQAHSAASVNCAMGFLESTVWRLFNSPSRDPFIDKSPKLLVTPSQTSISKFSLPSSQSSTSSSRSSSTSSASLFWRSPTPSRWSPLTYIPSNIRNAVSKRQVAVLACLILALLFWIMPPPHTWRRRVIHITIQEPMSNPYQVLRPAELSTPKKHARDPLKWLEQNSNNRHADIAGANLWKSVPILGHKSKKPRAALISLVRNSELPGLMQSMRQLEYHWNRKYNYPWIFFNDEPFSDEFKVSQ